MNKEILIENLETKYLISQRLVYDHLKSEQTKSHEFFITPECRKNCKLANGRYKVALQKAKENKEVTTKDLKRKSKLDEIDQVKKQKINIENTISELQNEIENETLAAEENPTSLVKAASFVRSLREKRELLKSLNQSQSKLEEEYKKNENFYEL